MLYNLTQTDTKILLDHLTQCDMTHSCKCEQTCILFYVKHIFPREFLEKGKLHWEHVDLSHPADRTNSICNTVNDLTRCFCSVQKHTSINKLFPNSRNCCRRIVQMLHRQFSSKPVDVMDMSINLFVSLNFGQRLHR